jgi:tRNA(fMet)-specific endonuclease VapC
VIPDDADLVLDTNVLVHAIRRSELGERLLDEYNLLARPHSTIISYVTLAELFVLGRRNGWGERKLQFIETVRMNMIVAPIERDSILQAYVDIDIATKGKVIGKNDLWIAATAQATGAYLVTTDRDFKPLVGSDLNLVLIDPETGDAYQ